MIEEHMMADHQRDVGFSLSSKNAKTCFDVTGGWPRKGDNDRFFSVWRSIQHLRTTEKTLYGPG